MSETAGKDKETPAGLDYSRRNLVFAVLSLCIACVIPLSAIFGSQSAFGQVSDFPQYYAAANLLLAGHAGAIYQRDAMISQQQALFPQLAGRGILIFIPPFSIILLTPLGLLAPESSYVVYVIASVAALVAGILLLAKYFELKKEGTIWLAAALFMSAPVFESLKIAQIAPFLFLSQALMLFLSKRRNDIAAGISLAILLLKPQELFPMALYLAFAGRFKLIASLAVVFLLLTVISLITLGEPGYAAYFQSLKDNLANTQYMQPELCATLRGQLLRFGIPGANIITAIALPIVFAFIAFVAFRNRRNQSRGLDGLLRVSLPLGLLFALHCHDYDLILLTPWVLSCLKDKHEDKLSKANKLTLILLVFLLMVPLYAPMHYGWLMKQQQALNPLFLIFAVAAIISTMKFITTKSSIDD